MIFNFLGDSITEGAGASSQETNYIGVLKKMFPNDEINNYGLGGTRIARQEELYFAKTYVMPPFLSALYNLDFNSRALTMKKADFVFVFGGTNDFGHGSAPIGNKDDKTPFTFYGAINCLIEYLSSNYGENNFAFLLPLPRYDQDSFYGGNYNTFDYIRPTFKQYKNAIKERCEFYKVKCLDFSNEFPRIMEPVNKGMFADGLHPNDIGYKKLADLFAKEIKGIKNE